MKKLFSTILVLGLLLSGNAYADIFLVCGRNEIKVDKKYIYQYFGSGAVDKYKITNKTSNTVSGFYKGKDANYDVFLDLNGKTLTVNIKNRKSGIVGSYTKDCY